MLDNPNVPEIIDLSINPNAMSAKTLLYKTDFHCFSSPTMMPSFCQISIYFFCNIMYCSHLGVT